MCTALSAQTKCGNLNVNKEIKLHISSRACLLFWTNDGSRCSASRLEVFRNVILLSILVTKYCILTVAFLWSPISFSFPSNPWHQKAFCSTQLRLTGYFLFWGPSTVKPRGGCDVKIPVGQRQQPCRVQGRFSPLPSPFRCSILNLSKSS